MKNASAEKNFEPTGQGQKDWRKAHVDPEFYPLHLRDISIPVSDVQSIEHGPYPNDNSGYSQANGLLSAIQSAEEDGRLSAEGKENLLANRGRLMYLELHQDPPVNGQPKID